MGQRHVCTFRHAQRAAYRTAISAAQILVILSFFISVRFLVKIYRVTTAITIPSIDNTSYKVSTFNRFLIAVVRLFCAAT